MSKKSKKPKIEQIRPEPKAVWKTVFDAKPMADGMPPHFLLYLLNEQPTFVRHGKLLTASLWLQSQMVAAVCLYDSPELRERCTIDNGRHLPSELTRATTIKLEALSSESLRREFARCFQPRLSEQLRNDLALIPLSRDALSHGYLSLLRQIIGPEADSIPWSPRPSPERTKTLEGLAGPRPENTVFSFKLSEAAFKEEIERICRVMDFIASELKDWNIHYPVFA